jgi:hypothetical protein
MSASAADAMVRSVIQSRGGIGSEQRRVLASRPADKRRGGRVHLVRGDHDDHDRGVPGPGGPDRHLPERVLRRHPHYLFQFDATTWGWIHLVIGLLAAFAGWGLLSGRTWARAAAITLAVLSAIANFLFIPYYPFWSLLIITLDIFVIWAVAAHGGDLREPV